MASTSSLSLFSSTFFDSNLHLNSSKTLKSLIVKTKPRSSRRTPTIRVEQATLPVLTFSGEKSGEAMLDLREAWPDTARSVIHRGLITDLQNKRRGTASTLTRAEVSGGGRKPLRQKGSGRARMGSIRTPLRPGGGVIFGPRPKDWSIKMNKKEKKLAISTALMSAAVNSVVVEDFNGEFSEKPRTKEFVAAMKRWGVNPSSPALIFCMEVSENVMLSSRNIGTVKVLTPRTLNLFDVLNAEKLVFTRSGVEYLNQMYGVDASLEEVDEGEEEEEEDEDVEEA